MPYYRYYYTSNQTWNTNGRNIGQYSNNYNRPNYTSPPNSTSLNKRHEQDYANYIRTNHSASSNSTSLNRRHGQDLRNNPCMNMEFTRTSTTNYRRENNPAKEKNYASYKPVTKNEVNNDYTSSAQRFTRNQLNRSTTTYGMSSFNSNNKPKEEELILTKYDICIYDHDIETLDGWLSDAIVNFLSLHLFENLPPNIKNKVNIVISTSVDAIKYDDGSGIADIFENLEISPRKWLFFIYNNNSNFGISAGSHWSLLVYNPNGKRFWFLDSINRGVPPAIKQLVSKMAITMKLKNKTVTNLNCPKMSNGSDCGVYVVEYINTILNNLTERKKWLIFERMLEPGFMTTRRSEWKKLMKDLAINNGDDESKTDQNADKRPLRNLSYSIRKRIRRLIKNSNAKKKKDKKNKKKRNGVK